MVTPEGETHGSKRPHTQVEERWSKGFRVAACEMNGWRSNMEVVSCELVCRACSPGMSQFGRIATS